MKNPMQPITKDARGTIRFKENKLVRALLDHGHSTGFGLNELTLAYGSAEDIDDWQQLAQLIGYSLSGYGDLSYVSTYAYGVAAAMAEDGLGEKDARIEYLEAELMALRSALREPVARLFGVHPDDLKN